MKQRNFLGLIAVMALALTGLLAAGSANATVLCSANQTPCSGGSRYGLNTELQAQLVSGTKTLLSVSSGTGGFTWECNGANLSGNTETEGSATTTVEGKLTGISFSECNCSVTVLKNGTFVLHHTGGTMNAAMTIEGFEWKVTCGIMHCVFNGNITSGLTLEGGAPGKILAAGATLPTSGESTLLCGKGSLTAEYEVTKPSPLYVSPS